MDYLTFSLQFSGFKATDVSFFFGQNEILRYVVYPDGVFIVAKMTCMSILFFSLTRYHET